MLLRMGHLGSLTTLGACALVLLDLQLLGFLNVPLNCAHERRQGLHGQFIEAGLRPIVSTAGANVDDVGDRLRAAQVDRDLKGLIGIGRRRLGRRIIGRIAIRHDDLLWIVVFRRRAVFAAPTSAASGYRFGIFKFLYFTSRSSTASRKRTAFAIRV